jgi:LPXTG-motif cell wall-anchored protein
LPVTGFASIATGIVGIAIILGGFLLLRLSRIGLRRDRGE